MEPDWKARARVAHGTGDGDLDCALTAHVEARNASVTAVPGAPGRVRKTAGTITLRSSYLQVLRVRE